MDCIRNAITLMEVIKMSLTEEQIAMIKWRGLNPKDKKVVWEDKDTLEVLTSRGRRYIIDKHKYRREK